MNLRSRTSSYSPNQQALSVAALDYSEALFDTSSGNPVALHICNPFIGAATLSVAKALKSEESPQWISAIRLEMDALFSGGTLIAEDLPVTGNYTIIHSTMPMRCKHHQDGTLSKFKARLCACGNELSGIIHDIYSPTISTLTYNAVHHISVLDDMSCCIIDVVGAYLHQDYPPDKPTLFLVLPDNVAKVCNLPLGIHYRIRKYLYGLPDAGLAYYKAYSAHLIAGGYQRTISDPCLFVKITSLGKTYAWCHVDDTFVCATTPSLLDDFKNHVQEKFPITSENNVEEYLGIKLTTLPGGCLLTQPKLLKQLESEFHDHLIPFSRATTPQRQLEYQDQNSTSMDSRQYLHLLGSLIYLTKSRPEISTAVSFAARHGVSPTVGQFSELLHCLSYILKTREHGLFLRRGEPNAPLHLYCYADASYLTHAESSQSHAGYCLSFGKIGTFYSKSQVIKLVSTSSTHAELRALYALTIDIIFIIHLCDEIHRPLQLPAIVFIDNQPLLDLTRSISPRGKRCKHLLMMIDWLREQITAGYLDLIKIPTVDNVADILTKIVTGGSFTSKAALLCDWQS